jgi:hypothetical protein
MSVTHPGPSEQRREPDGRRLTFAMMLAGALALALLVQNLGWKRGWAVWGVSTQELAWLDLRVVTGAVQTLREGGNPYVANPHDPMGRPFNYPSLWLRLFPGTGAAASVDGLAGSAAVLAAAAVLLATGRTTRTAGGVIGLLLLSPALTLAVERGNTDLIVFALVGVGAAVIGDGRSGRVYAGVGLLVLASLLKIYPVVSLAVLIGWKTSRARIAAVVGLVFCAGWFAWHGRETLVAIGNTQIGAIHSYGRTVLPFALDLRDRAMGRAGAAAGYALFANLAAVVCVLAAAWRGLKMAAETSAESPLTARARLGWLIGGGIFLATFAAGSSFSYRLWFLLPGVPWLVTTAERRDEPGRWARAATGGLLLLCFGSGVWDLRLFWLGQAGGWVAFAAGGALWAAALAGGWRSAERSGEQAGGARSAG